MLIPVDGKSVRVTDPFFSRYFELVRLVMIPYMWEVMNDRVDGVAKSHAIANFRIAAGLEEGEFYGYCFQDSDVAKWLEAVAHSLAAHPDPELETLADEAIDLIGKAQQPDGYLNTRFTIKDRDKRWANEKENHETYVAGHLIEAAVAYFHATGKRQFLDIARRNADHIDSVFGPEEGKKRGYPGHQVIEMALVGLFEATGDARYARLAKFFIDERGKRPHFFDLEAAADGRKIEEGILKDEAYEYTLSHLPVREQRVATGHAVRAVYMYSGMADVARLSGDRSLAEACERLWDDLTRRQMSITGGIGQQEHWEGFSRDYDLPNERAYNETCASVGLVFWAKRMAALELKGDYYDVAERALYNGALAGISLDGRKFFYVNLLESIPSLIAGRCDSSHAAPTRKGWFGCACCPPNLARLLASLGDYLFSASGDCLAVHLYVGAEVELAMGGVSTRIVVESGMPWSGEVKIRLFPKEPVVFSLYLRKPGWARIMSLSLNGRPEPLSIDDGYSLIRREWREGDELCVDMPMPVRRIQAHSMVRADAGKVALARGPIVYCLEEKDNGPLLSDLVLDRDCEFQASFESELLGGVVAIRGSASRSLPWLLGGTEADLYRDFVPGSIRVPIKAVPYFAWDNRGENEMAVWIRQR